jgi:hypothetical protein
MTAIAVSQSIERSMFRRVMLSSVIGTAIEWYDFFLYATASALVFGQCLSVERPVSPVCLHNGPID